MGSAIDYSERVRAILCESAAVKRQTADVCTATVVKAARMIAQAFRADRKILLCGNGGSAADCQHMAAEFVSRLTKDFERPGLPALALTTDSSFLTAFSNDCGFEGVFERQVQAIGQDGDVLIAISTSGNSLNIIRAVTAATAKGMHTVGLMGRSGAMTDLVDLAVSVPSVDTQRIQESHLAIEHAICDLVESILFREVLSSASSTT